MIIRAFEAQVEKSPDRLALKGEKESITYRELNRYANRVAYRIQKALSEDSSREIDTVGLLLDHGPRMITAILGTLKAGKAYVPLAPDYPEKRIFYILTHSRASLVITDTGYEKKIENMLFENNVDIGMINLDTDIDRDTDAVSEEVTGRNPDREIIGNKIAYIMYTSGSTGNPKGVVQTHENVMYYTRNWTRRFSITSSDRMTLFSSFSHDGSLQDMFGALHNGAVLYPYDMRNREASTGLSDFLIKERITIWHSVPSLYSYFAGTLTGEEKFKDLRFILLGGEPVRQHEVAVLKKFFPFSTLANVYGQTESSVDSIQLISPRDSFEKTVIGEPLDETQIFVIDDQGNEVEPLETGEIIVASRYVSPGYWRDEETTRKIFRESPDLGSLYRTGDLGCLLLDGNIEFLGRKDWQVKIRGYRVELGEIESVLLQHDEIHEAVATAIESENINGTEGAGEGPGDKYIAAYYVSGRTFEPSELREYLSRYLPDYMIPTYFVRLDAFPFTTSRKIDRKALPRPTAVSERQYIAPRNEIEEKLVEIWAEVLKQSPSSIGIDDNFFDLGGHSLKAALLVAKFHQVLNARLPLVQIFRTPSIRELSRCIKEMHREQFFAVPRLEEKEYYDVSNAQQRVWIQSQEKQASLSFNMNGAYVIEADLDKHTVDKVFETLIRRHESLRTVFITVDELPKQKILPPDKTGFNVEHMDWLNLREEEIQARTRELALSELNTPFDLSRGPLLRVKLLQVKEKTFIFLFTMHHIVSDALSMGVLFREIFLLYRCYRTGENKHNPLTPLRILYRDYAAWQNEQLSGEELRRAKAYWLHRLGGDLRLKRLQLPADKERPKILTYNGGAVYLNIAASLTGQLKGLARRHGMTLFMVLTAAFKALLARYSGQTDIIIGTVAACREYAELENQVGYYLNTLTLRTTIDPADSVDMLLEKVKETVLSAYEHQLYPFDRLVGDLGIPRETNRHPLFDVAIDMVNYQPAQAQETAAGSSMKVSPYGTGYNRSKFDLTLYAFEGKDLVGLKFEYGTDLFEHGTIQRMGERFLKLLKCMAAARESGACVADLLEEEDQDTALPNLESVPGRGQDREERELKVPASYHQERLWFIDTFENGNIYESAPVYHNVPLLLEITGDLDIPSLKKRIQAVIRRHEALRTRIITIDNRPVQWIREEQEADFHLPVKDLTEDANPYSLEKAVKLVMEETQRPFLIEKDLMIRGLLIILEKKRLYLLAITLHHLIVDRCSLEILCRDLFAPGLDGPLFQYIDFSQWQREFMSSPSYSGGTLDTLMYYWRWQLRGKLQTLQLPTDRPRAPIHIYNSGWQPFTFPHPLTDKIYTLINREGISPFVFFLAVFKTLLHRYSNQEEIVVGTGMKNRDQPGSENILGPIANLVVLRSFLSQWTMFNNLLSQLKKTMDEAAKYQAAPFDLLVLKLKPEVDMSRTALFDVLFQYEEDTFQLPPMENLEVNVIETNLGWGKYDLNLLIKRKADRCTGVLVYNRYYHNAATISRFIGHFMVLLEEVLSEPHRQISQFNLLTEEEQRQLLIEWNQTRIDYPTDRTIHQLFEEQAAKAPDGAALVGSWQLVVGKEKRRQETVQFTYKELDGQANRLAHLLREKGVQPDTIVGMLMERSVEMIIWILGILKAGGAYLPINPEYPQERIDFMLKDSGTKILLTNLSEGHRFNCQLSMSSPGAHLHHSGNLAYIIYTSGTTGQPKGCLITHKNVISLLKNKIQPFDFNENDIWTMFHQYNFDFSVWEMYGALLYGGKLIVIPRMVTRDPGQYLEILKQEKVTVLNQTPSAFYHLADAEVSQPDRRLYLRYVIFGGEALNPARLKPWRAKYPDTKLINMFGITETTIHVTHKEIGDKEIETGASNIGRPLATLTAYVLDQNLNPVPIGVPGELCVGGEGLARGYLNRPGLTAEKFCLRRPGGLFSRKPPPWTPRKSFSLEKKETGKEEKTGKESSMSYMSHLSHRSSIYIYKSGDLVKLLENGDIEYLGRIDHQVKIRGFRIELGEIEMQLLKHKGVKETVVLSRQDKSGNPFLCAYIVWSRIDTDADETELRKHLSRVLPDYMVPAYFLRLARIPLTPNGKVDRSALPEPKEYRLNLQQTYVAPENEQERKIAEVWQEVLQLERVGTRDNFFEIGGDSLKSIRLKSKLEEILNQTIPVVVLFERMTIRSFVEYLTELEKNEAGLGPGKKIDRSEAITRAKESRAKQRIKRKVRSQNVEE